mgnify:CR=1 FL=1
MPDEKPQPSETGDQKSGIQIPKERFDEVSAAAKDAKARAESAEAKYQEVLKGREADAARIAALERRFAPEREEPEYEDPAEKAAKEVAVLRKRLDDREAEERTQAAYRADGAAITAAMEKAGVEDKKKGAEALATQYGAAKHFGGAWDPVASAEAYRKDEKEAAELRARAARDNADATRSAITGSGSPPAVATTPPPKRPEPGEKEYRAKLATWEADMEARIIAEARAGG